jgi:hypothetical protein
MNRYTDFLTSHHGRVFSIALESGEPLIVTVGEDNTLLAAFPDRRRIYRQTVSSAEADIYTLAEQPGFTITYTLPGVLMLSADARDAAYVWHLEDSESSDWVQP